MTTDDDVDLDRSVRSVLTPSLVRMLVGVGFSSLGAGLTLSLVMVYLHQVRGFELRTAGFVLTYQAVVGLVLAPVAGAIIDRVGPRPVLMVAATTEAVGVLLLAFVTTVPQAFGAATVIALGSAGLWPAQTSMLSRMTTPERRQRVFGLQFMLLNLGLGLGGLVGASILDVTRPGTFTAVYVVNALSYAVYVLAVASVRGVDGPEVHDSAEDAPSRGYRDLLADRRMRRFLIGSLILLTCGYGSIEAGVPAFMTAVVGLPVTMIGIVFFFNTILIVGAQVWVLRRLEGRSRSRLLGVIAVLWAVCWLLFAGSAGVGAVPAAVVITIAIAVFAVGEMIWSPVGPSLVNDVAPPELRGRYNATMGLVWGVGGAIGPAYAGIVIGSGFGVVWAVTLAVGCLVGGLVLGSLRGLLSAAEDGREPREAVEAVRVGG